MHEHASHVALQTWDHHDLNHLNHTIDFEFLNCFILLPLCKVLGWHTSFPLAREANKPSHKVRRVQNPASSLHTGWCIEIPRMDCDNPQCLGEYCKYSPLLLSTESGFQHCSSEQLAAASANKCLWQSSEEVRKQSINLQPNPSRWPIWETQTRCAKL